MPRAVRARHAISTAIRAVMLTMLCALAACSTLRLTYGQGPFLAYWWIDGYADFDREQSPRVKAALARWFAWHRHTELPKYTALLERAQHEVQGDVTPAQVCGWVETLLPLRDAAALAMVPDVAQITATLTPAQHEHIARKFEQSNAKWRDEHLQPDLHKRERASLDRATDYANKLYGRLQRSQQELLASQVRAAPWQPDQALAEREAHQRDTLHTLTQLAQQGLPPAEAQNVTRAWLLRLSQPVDEAARARRARDLRYWCDASAALHNRTDTYQRQHAVEALKTWQVDLQSFAESLP